MLKDILYKILSTNKITEGISYQILLFGDCPIYTAHFPGKPITPGVCILQMVEELLADYTLRNLRIAIVKNAKFLNVLTPTEEVIQFYLFSIIQEEEKIKVQSTVTDSSGTIYAKISLICNAV